MNINFKMGLGEKRGTFLGNKSVTFHCPSYTWSITSFMKGLEKHHMKQVIFKSPNNENTFFSFKLAFFMSSPRWPFFVFFFLAKSAGTSRWLKYTLCIVAENIYSTLFRKEQLRTTGRSSNVPHPAPNWRHVFVISKFRQYGTGFKANTSSSGTQALINFQQEISDCQ